ncbi:MAG: glutamate racemase [Kangiellaceae bacterium]
MNLLKSSPIGIFDSGVGGLSIVKAIQALMPNENLIYVADSLYAPYGTKPNDFIIERSSKISEFLLQKNVKAIVVACNTATASSIKTLRDKHQIPIIGLEPALKPAIKNSQSNRVGVLATESTLKSEKYRLLKSSIADNIELIEVASSLFVELVESAKEIDQATNLLIEKELQPMINANIDSLVLGCTHYPFLEKPIQKIMGKNTQLFESGLPVAEELKRKISNNMNTNQFSGEITYYSSQSDVADRIFNLLLNKNIVVNSLAI